MKQQFIKSCFPLALKAREQFVLNPVTILAQGALESGWGRSVLATKYNNYFGLCGFGKPNDFWHGGKATLREGGLEFRRYATAEDSFLDYARLIRNCYPQAAALSEYPEAFAREIAYSRYISETNGDNRESYRQAIVCLCSSIELELIQLGFTV